MCMYLFSSYSQLKQVCHICFKLKEEVFTNRVNFNSKALDNILLGYETRMSDVQEL